MKEVDAYKFAIKQILANKAGHLIPVLKKDLQAKLGISRTWLSRIVNARVGSKIKLDHQQLIIFADVLQCPLDALITQQCKIAIRAIVQEKTVVTINESNHQVPSVK